jgi:hypothetical protein
VAASKQERVKASKLRSKKHLTAAQHQWLSAYESRKAVAKAAQVPKTTTRESPVSLSGNRTDQGASVRVHETKRLDDSIDPLAFTFKPLVPEAGSGAMPLAPGMPQPPPPGSPLVDELPVQTQPQVSPAGVPLDANGKPLYADPVAKAQFQGMVMALCMVGVRSANQLMADQGDMPDMVRDALANPHEGLALVKASAGNLAEKWKLQRVPGGDEAVVGGACVASGLAWFAVQKKRKATKGRQPSVNVETSPTTNAATSPREEGVDVPAQPPPRQPSVNVSAFTGDDL